MNELDDPQGSLAVDEEVEDESDDLFMLRKELEAKLAEAEPQLTELQNRVRRLRGALRALNDEEEDASAAFRAPGSLAGRISPQVRNGVSRMGLAGEELRKLMGQVMKGQGSMRKGEIMEAIEEKGFQTSDYLLGQLTSEMLEEGALESEGTGAGTKYRWLSGYKIKYEPRLTQQQRAALELTIETLVREEPRNATQLHQLAIGMGVESRKGTVQNILAEWREEGKVETREAVPGRKNTVQWHWIG